MRRAFLTTLLAWYFAVIAPGGGSVTTVGPFGEGGSCEKIRIAVVTEILRAAGRTEVAQEDVFDAKRVPPCWSTNK